MSGAAGEPDLLPDEVRAHYASGYEAQRLQPAGHAQDVVAVGR